MLKIANTIAYLIIFLIACISTSLIANHIPDPFAPYRIVFIHLGATLPSFLPIALSQAHIFCPKAEIILIANWQATTKQNLNAFVKIIYAEEIQKTIEHEDFVHISTLNKYFREGFWYYTTERLFYLDDLIQQYNLKNIFHLENDNLIYVDLEELLPDFINHYSGIAAPFESEQRGFANFLFVPDKYAIHALACHLRNHASSGQSEMFLLNSFKNEYGEKYIDHLPTIMNEYVQDHGLATFSGYQCTIDPALFTKNIDTFHSLFDGCAYGQYLGGIDPRNGSEGPGYINLEAFFNVSLMNLVWEKDKWGRRIPYVIYKEKKFRINNLHVHSKNLIKLSSLYDLE